MPHWHKYNPWKNDIVYISLEEAAECCEGGLISLGVHNDNVTVQRDKWFLFQQWKLVGDKLDAYILPQPSGDHCIGIRYGKKDYQYLSPGIQNMQNLRKINEILKKFKTENLQMNKHVSNSGSSRSKSNSST